MNTLVDNVVAEISTVLLGKNEQIKMSLCCLFAGGHLLLEDLPGMGKTTLSHALADVLGLDYKRVQFTSDLLPSDIIGVSIYDKANSAFEFKPGPIFSQLLLADEINRATPKTQSALLEAMAEAQVSCDGERRALPTPFFVIASQNPTNQSGTFTLPESQLDRFLMCMAMGYPNRDAELAMYQRGQHVAGHNQLKQIISIPQLIRIQEAVNAVTAAEPLLDYLHRLVTFTRDDTKIGVGLSPRAGLGLLQSAKAWAYINGRDYVVPEDVQHVFPCVAGHRLLDSTDFSSSGSVLVERVLRGVSVFK
ncbi:MoxR-like ATPase [Sinobacterium caligoides]|uniref:MoxR-like ATPase n=1 Tax=Sinobacterium caligoides TaxID=933926 RepID=A0A3N2DJU3_9GAMM|nr:MoxR family ATPase [Sinobacterium caligoides]ROR99958.1 MoxR-like ATPase [Sinobacterium caligoides]